MVGASREQRVGPLREVGGKQRTSESQVNDLWPAHCRHREAGIDPRGIEEGVAKVHGPVEIWNRGGQLIFLEGFEGLGGQGVDVEVAQCEDGPG